MKELLYKLLAVSKEQAKLLTQLKELETDEKLKLNIEEVTHLVVKNIGKLLLIETSVNIARSLDHERK